jgi:hypothetical protein
MQKKSRPSKDGSEVNREASNKAAEEPLKIRDGRDRRQSGAIILKIS